MHQELKGKKLLIMGANPETTPLVKLANEMGIKTIVTSNRADDDAKKYAWKASDVDGIDVPGLISLAREEKVDGVLVGVADILVPAYCKVCDALGLPCYATQEIVDVFSYKDVFKATCERYGIHGIPEYYLDENLNEDDIAKIKYPVMVKPVDSCSGIGMTVCYEKSELKNAVEKALNASKKKRFIVEKYMSCDDVGIYYTFKDGMCSISCVFDRYTSNEQIGVSKVNLGSIYPSKHLDDYYKRFHENACRMFKDIGIKNGVLLLSAFFENGEFYVYDPGFRLQGEASHLIMKAIHGFDQREMLINFALQGNEGNVDLDKEDSPELRGKYAATFWLLLKKGKIKKISGLKEIQEHKNIVSTVQRLYEGDDVLEEWIGTEKQVLARLYVVCDTRNELKDTLRYYRESISVTSEEGKDMLLSGFDLDRALEL